MWNHAHFIPTNKKSAFNFVLSNQPGILISSGPPYFGRARGNVTPLPPPRLSAVLFSIIHYKPTWLHVQNHVQSLSVMRYLLIQARQVKFILDIIFVHLDINMLLLRIHPNKFLRRVRSYLIPNWYNFEISEWHHTIVHCTYSNTNLSGIFLRKVLAIFLKPVRKHQSAVQLQKHYISTYLLPVT